MYTHITTQQPFPSTAAVFPEALALVLHDGNPALLQGPVPLLLDVAQHVRVVMVDAPRARQTAIHVVSYVYTLMTRDRIELVSFQWHPHGVAEIEFPHVHIGPALIRHDSVVRPGEAHKIHLPTGEVSLADVVRLAITEFGVVPRRDDWEEVLRRPDVLV